MYPKVSRITRRVRTCESRSRDLVVIDRAPIPGVHRESEAHPLTQLVEQGDESSWIRFRPQCLQANSDRLKYCHSTDLLLNGFQKGTT